MINLKHIFQEVDALENHDIMELLTKLINIDTTVPPGRSYREYVNAISPYFKNLGYSLEEVEIPNNLIEQIPFNLEGPRINLVATKEYGKEKYITFYGHMDVVPATTEGADTWRFPPFKATMIKSGKIYGRGVADCKGSMACLILALQIIERLNIKPKYNVIILNCTDEELGFYPGVRYLTEQGYVKGTVFCMDYIIDPVILMAAAGDLDIEIETIGRSCHSGLNFLGINALEEMVPILVELMKLKKEVEKRESKDIPGFYIPKTGEKSNMRPMFNLDIIKSGEKSNIVPDSCRLTINRRILPDENIEDVKKEILDAIEKGKAKSKALKINTTFEYGYPPLKVDINSNEIKKIQKVISLVQDTPEEKIKQMGMSITFDMGFVSQILDKKDIIIRGVANSGSNAHGVNETIQLRDIKKFIKEIITFLCVDI
jgi:succinyl-diaminopimelate desuccinylase